MKLKYLLWTSLFTFLIAKSSSAYAWNFGDPLPPGYTLPYGDSACALPSGSGCDPEHNSEHRIYDFDMFDGWWKSARHSYPYAQAPNGCSSAGALVENFGPADFKPACDAHDICYYRPNYQESISVEACNGQFINDLLHACDNAFDVRIKTCTEWKFVLRWNFQKEECIGYSSMTIPSTIPFGDLLSQFSGMVDPVLIPGIGNVKQACQAVASAVAGISEAGFSVFNTARQKQAKYEDWVTARVVTHQNGIISDKINPAYLRVFHRPATDEEIVEGNQRLQQYPNENFDTFVEGKLEDYRFRIFMKAWGLCDGCLPPLYYRAATPEENFFVTERILAGYSDEQIEKQYLDFVDFQIKAYLTKVFEIPVDEAYLNGFSIASKLMQNSPEDIMGILVKNKVAEINLLLGINITSQPNSWVENEMKTLAAMNLNAYFGMKIFAIIGPVLYLMQ
ncbi:MAG: hypothetical protein EOP04_00720 [Proteobacteria bacterium]|nr:MAG: hypothetical protein EOP04_00720 [Pseudomonadota bacterium]